MDCEGSGEIRNAPVEGHALEGVESDVDLEVHTLELLAYGAVLKALKAQANELTWEKEAVITDLRKILKVSNGEHSQLLKMVSSDDYMRDIWNMREGVRFHNQVISSAISANCTKEIISGSGNALGDPSPSLAVGVQPLITSSLKRRHPSDTCLPWTNAVQPVSDKDLTDDESGVGLQNVANQVASLSISANQKIPGTGNAFGASSSSLRPHSVAAGVQPLITSPVEGGTPPGYFGPRTIDVQPTFAPSNLTICVPPKNLMDDSSEIGQNLVGWRLMKRLPADNKFHEAVITGYNPVTGHHSLLYNRDTPNATVEWVDIKEIPPEDFKLMGVDCRTSPRFEIGESSKRGRPRGRPPLKNKPGKGKPSPKNEPANIYRGGLRQDPDLIEIYFTDSLIHKVEKMLDGSEVDPLQFERAMEIVQVTRSEVDPLQFERAMEIVQEQEEALIQAIARLNDDDDEHPPGNDH